MTEDIANVASGLTIAFLILAFLLLTAGYARIALPVAFLGIVGVSFTTVWRTFPPPRITELEGKIADGDKELASLKGRANHLEQTLKATRTELQSRDENWRKQVDRVAGEVSALVERFDRFLAAVNQEKRAPTPTPDRPLAADVVNRLASVMEASPWTLVTPSFQISPVTNAELVTGRKGFYYIVHLLDPLTKRQFVFAEREYALPSGRDAIVTAFQHFKASVLDVLGNVARVDMFLRGGADVRPFEAPWGEGGPPPPVSVLKRGDGGTYASDLQTRAFGPVLRNDDLPDLRAAHMAKILRSTIGMSKLDILSNAPARDGNELHRTVEIILFIGA